jgi:hypothetical protein
LSVSRIMKQDWLKAKGSRLKAIRSYWAKSNRELGLLEIVRKH